METFTGRKTQRQLVAHGDYSSVAIFQTEVTAMFLGYLGILAVFKDVHIFRHFSRNP